MKFPLRILLPILAAILLAGGLLGYAWWQLSDTALQLQRQLMRTLGQVSSSAGGGDSVPDAVDAADAVLLHLRQGDVAALQGDWNAAEREYRAAADAGGGIAALRKLATAQMQRRDIEGVKRTIQDLRRLGARNDDLLLLQAVVLLRTGELAKAEQLLRLAQDDSPQKHYGLALLWIIQGKHDDAKKELVATVAGWDPALRASARVLQSAYDEFALFEESTQIHLTTLLARALAQVQECELALPLLGQVVKAQDDYRDAWTVQGYCEFTTERFAEALSSFERAYAIDPEKPEIQYFLGRTYIALAQPKNASTFLQYALINGFEPKKEVRKRLADAAQAAGDLPLALEQLRELIQEPDADIALFDRLVTVSLQTGKAADAEQYAQAAVQRWPDDAKAQELLKATKATVGGQL